jgi:hypothetical protein
MSDIMNAASGVKGAATVAAGTVGIGIAEKLDLLNGFLGAISLTLGIIIGVTVLITRWLEYKIIQRKENDIRAQDRIP